MTSNYNSDINGIHMDGLVHESGQPEEDQQENSETQDQDSNQDNILAIGASCLQSDHENEITSAQTKELTDTNPDAHQPPLELQNISEDSCLERKEDDIEPSNETEVTSS